ncbi:MAG: alpha/beta hydrolase [Limnochordia bacterium]|jgi:dienelactone hydrolase
MHIHDYLTAIAERITAGSPHFLHNGTAWETCRKEKQQQFHTLLGLDYYLQQPRTPLRPQVTRVHQRTEYRIECLYFESLPGLYVAGNLYVPHGAVAAPAILYLCGHLPGQKVRYQEHARRFAELGFVVLILDTIRSGEVFGLHHGSYNSGHFNWISKGYSPAAVETWNAMRAIDYLETRPEVDAGRIGATGNSGGGSMTWSLMAADDRIQAGAPSCSTGTIAAHVRERTIDYHCDCTFPINAWGWEMIDFASLCAPRPVLIAAAERDSLFSLDAIRDFYARLKRVYSHTGAAENLQLVTHPGAHGYAPNTRRRISQWFLRHLQGREISCAEIADFDGHVESSATLQVFVHGCPANDRSTSAHDWFIPKARMPEINTPQELRETKRQVVAHLRKYSFATFPQPLPDPQPRRVREYLYPTLTIDFTYKPEPGWQLTGRLTYPGAEVQPRPAVIELLNPTDTRSDICKSTSMLKGALPNWIHGSLSPRGTGDTAWSPHQQWNLRRSAALVGRTLASLRVLDTLQGLQAIRQLGGVDTSQLYLAARGEMAIVALYAALLDGNLSGVLLKDLPATLDQPGDMDGTGMAPEIINALRFADLPHAAGLLWPAKLVFIGRTPASYQWAMDLYERLADKGGWWRVESLTHWRPKDI